MRKKLLIIGLVLLAALLLSGCTGSTAWPGLSTDGEKYVYLANAQSVYSINLGDGTVKWQYPLQADSKKSFYSNPVIAPNGLVIFGSVGVDHSLFAIDPSKFPNTPVQTVGGLQKFLCNIGMATCPEEYHVEAWIFTGAKDHWVASQLIVNDTVFAPNADGNLYILSVKDGSLIKKLAIDSKGQSRLWGQPVTDGKRVFITSLDRSVVAIDAQTYDILWHEDLSGAIPGGAALGSDGMLYVGSLAKQLEKFDPETGKHESVFTAKGDKGWIWGTPVVDGDTLYFSDIDGYFYSYNTRTGQLNWEPIKPDNAITASPLVQTDRVLIATESGTIYSINKQDGSYKLWRQVEKKGKIYTTPVTGGGFVLAAYLESDYYLIALDQDGNKKWTFPAGK
jgi:outer membrane protein assembly factor BamB